MDHLTPMSDWEETQRDPLLVWRTRIDGRWLVEVQRAPWSDEAVFCVFDREDDLKCVCALPVYHVLPFEGGEPAREDVEDWAEKIRRFLERIHEFV